MPTAKQLMRNARIRRYRRPKLLALAGAPFRRGLIYKLTTMTPRKPNSAKRKIAKVRIVYNLRRVFASVPGKGDNLHEYSAVLLRGGSAKDLPGVNYALMRGLLDFAAPELFQRMARRSKFGIKRPLKT
jgi:small subunit ribosomal protein S12